MVVVMVVSEQALFARSAQALLAPNRLRLMAVSFAFGFPELSARISHRGCWNGNCLTSTAAAFECSFDEPCVEGPPTTAPGPLAAGVARWDCTGEGCVARCCARLCICCMCCICWRGVGVAWFEGLR